MRGVPKSARDRMWAPSLLLRVELLVGRDLREKSAGMNAGPRACALIGAVGVMGLEQFPPNQLWTLCVSNVGS
eukprot:3717482-Pyramimonas_sp.AAC.1